MSVVTKVGNLLKRYFVSGLLVTVPVIITYFVLRFLFNALDSLLKPIVYDFLGYNIPGLGAAVTILLVLLVGVLAANFVGARLFHYGDRVLVRLPVVRIVYSAAKQLVNSLFASGPRAFSEVVMIEYPRKGLYAIGFLAHYNRLRRDDDSERKIALVFIPSTPTPFSGMVVAVPVEDIHRLDIGVEEAIKILVSGGIAAPDMFTIRPRLKNTR
jgi:uncharacterized membrane protein